MENSKTNRNKYPSRFEEMEKRAKQVGRVIAFLTREQMDFIDKISKDALFSTGKKLSRSEVIQAIVEAVRKLDLSGKDIHSNDELGQRILEISKKALPAVAEELNPIRSLDSEDKRTSNGARKGEKNETD